MSRTILQICVTEYSDIKYGGIETSESVNIDPLSTEEGLKKALKTLDKTRDALIKLLPPTKSIYEYGIPPQMPKDL